MALKINGIKVAGIGKPGEGVAKGGTSGQILTKKSNTDYDTEWVDIEIPEVDLSSKADADHTHPLATTTTTGMVMVDGTAGVGVNTENGNLYIKQASNSDIDDKQHSYKPITPDNLDYAVKAALVNNANELSGSEREAVSSWIGAIAKNCVHKETGDITDLYGTESCRYIISSDVTGMPTDGYWWHVDTFSRGSTDMTVVAYKIVADKPKVYVKICATSVWSDWHEVLMEDADGHVDVDGELRAVWLQTTADNHRTNPAEKIAVIDGGGWIYYRTPSEALSDMGGQTKLTGSSGQMIGFDSNGNPVAQAIPESSSLGANTYTLTTSGWSDNGDGRFKQTISVPGVTTDVSQVIFVDAALTGEDLDADAATLGAWGPDDGSGPSSQNVAQSDGTLTFYCTAVPTVNIPVFVGVS